MTGEHNYVINRQAYTIKEMKTIVDYLKDNKLYGEIKGRKMWMDFASSQLTNRTWQSLKETFLKRVFPDLHNPYYNLTIEQINSFRSGYDVSDRHKNKLEIHPVSDDSDVQQSDLPQTSNGNDKEQESNAGETKKSSKVTLRSRSSADTVIVDTCYETAEDIQKELESTSHQKENGETKSLRDCITYSEPLTPMLQEVLDDFQSEPENDRDTSDKENPLQIVEQPDIENLENISNEVSKIVKENQNDKSEVVNDVSQKDSEATDATVGEVDKKIDEDQPTVMSNSKLNTKENTTSCLLTIGNENESEGLHFNKDDVKQTATSNIIDKPVEKDIKKTSKEVTEKAQTVIPLPDLSSREHNNSNTPDSSIPNNPEALNKRLSNENQDEKTAPSESTNETKVCRKRLNSESTVKVNENKKTKLELKKIKANSENESKRVDKTVGNVKAKSVEPISKPKENNNINNKKNAATKTESLEKASTSKSNISKCNIEKKPLISETEQKSAANKSPEIRNPCLNNLSLYNEQFNDTKYNSSGSSDVDKNKEINPKVSNEKNIQQKQKEVVKLDSCTESDDEESNVPPKKKHRAGVVNIGLEKQRGLANVFGFTSGAAHSKRKRRLSRRRRTISKTVVSQNNDGSNSSEWTSESDNEAYVSPPRSRKNRPSKKYLKPRSATIHSLEEEGGLFVMYGRKIYPLIKDGKLVKNYLSYQPESESDEENYWKLKYVEEKKKSAELKKLLQEAKVPQASTSRSSPVRPDRTSTSNRALQQESSTNNNAVICLPGQEYKKEETKPKLPENIKIKFTTKNDQEIHLEGNWNQLQNALEHVVHIFHKEPEPISVNKPKLVERLPSSSGITSPVDIFAIEESPADSETHEKVDKIESKIFQEIEEIDKHERDPSEEIANVTKRRGRRATVSSSSESIPKRIKTSVQRETPVVQNNANDDVNNAIVTSATPVKNKENDDTPKRQLRTPRKNSNESSSASVTEPARITRSAINTEVNEDEEIRYMLPPQNKKRNSRTADKKTDGLKKSMPNGPKTNFSSEITSQNFADSTQGYQDSDVSPMKNETRKKKKLTSSFLNSKYLRRSTRIKPSPFIYYNDSSVSSIETTEKKVKCDSTLDTVVYRSESYQLLMQPAKQLVADNPGLSSINEIEENMVTTEKNELSPLHVNIDPFIYDSGLITCDIESSSHISLPLSPELSVVESLSISKEMLNIIEEQPTINEMECNDINTETCKNLLTSEIVPMMQSTLESCQVSIKKESNSENTLVTDSLLKKVKAFKIEDQNNLTDTLGTKLRDLLLESSKKNSTQNLKNKTDNMDVDNSNKEKPKKRCSTPRKRKDSHKSKKALKIHNVIEEEHIQSCSQVGRKSCPPVIETVPLLVDEELNISNLAIDENVTSKGRKKKDVIKVKITRPKNKKSQYNSLKKTIKDNVTKSITYNDSGINNTESGEFLSIDDSVDLIHNHSDTCLQTNECIGDSVEFIENSNKSIVSLNDSQSKDSTCHSRCKFHDADLDSADFFSNDAQDVRSFYKNKQDILNTSDTVYHSPVGTELSSLITDDLSDDPSPSIIPLEKWYLLSEDETTNINKANEQRSTNIASFGSNLHQIFPISFAVPDLSTITEMSKENEDFNQRSTVDGLTSDGFSF